MGALSQLTTRVGLGQLATCQSYRNPAYLTKIALRVDVMSGRRLEVGLGAGWFEAEHKVHGYPFPGVRECLDRMAETAGIFNAMWTADQGTAAGAHLSIEGAINEPKPLQRPHPRLWVGGVGKRVLLRHVLRLQMVGITIAVPRNSITSDPSWPAAANRLDAIQGPSRSRSNVTGSVSCPGRTSIAGSHPRCRMRYPGRSSPSGTPAANPWVLPTSASVTWSSSLSGVSGTSSSSLRLFSHNGAEGLTARRFPEHVIPRLRKEFPS